MNDLEIAVFFRVLRAIVLRLDRDDTANEDPTLADALGVIIQYRIDRTKRP